jgi:hypothetical protein
MLWGPSEALGPSFFVLTRPQEEGTFTVGRRTTIRPVAPISTIAKDHYITDLDCPVLSAYNCGSITPNSQGDS